MNTRKQSLIDLRNQAKKAVIGSVIKCPSCKTEHTKKSYNTIFCKTTGKSICKDHYWNNIDPKKRNNTTRISQASAAYMSNPDRVQGYTSEGYRIINGVAYDEFDDPVYVINEAESDDYSWDAHK